MKSIEYTRVGTGDVDSSTELKPARQNVLVLILSSTTALFAFLSVVLMIELWGPRSSSHSHGFPTELDPTRGIVQLQEKAFTGGLVYDDSDHLYRENEPGQTQYVGTPSPEIDAAWNELLSPLGMVLKGEDALAVAGKTYQEPDGSWLLTLDVYHSLHCVNLARQALDPDYYQPEGMGQDLHTYRIHVDHCLDYIRQSLQCAGDLTPLTYQYSESRARRYPVFGAVHTCRNFEAIHEWATHRLGNYSL